MPFSEIDLELRREQRRKKTAEIFTPVELIDQMIDRLPEGSLDADKTFCDPTCGNGNMLVRVLERKLQLGHDSIRCLKSLYGCDIMQDNIRECRVRLLECLPKVDEQAIRTVCTNIVWVSLEKHPTGSLLYDFSFKEIEDDMKINEWVKAFEENLSKDNLPVVAASSNTRNDAGIDIFA